MENIFLIKAEIITFFISLSYCVYFIFDKIYNTFFRIRKIIKPITKQEAIKKEVEVVNIKDKENNYKVEKQKNSKISTEDKLRLNELIKRVKTNSTKGYFDAAKKLINEGLSIEKSNKELNIELASIYEREKVYTKAIYIYKDLIEIYKNDVDICKNLGYIYAIQGKYKKAIKIYTSIYKKNKNDMGVIEYLIGLNFEIKDYRECLKFIKRFLKDKPRNVEKLTMGGVCYQNIGKTTFAVDFYKRVLEIQPYNNDIIEKLKKIAYKNKEVSEKIKSI